MIQITTLYSVSKFLQLSYLQLKYSHCWHVHNTRIVHTGLVFFQYCIKPCRFTPNTKLVWWWLAICNRQKNLSCKGMVWNMGWARCQIYHRASWALDPHQGICPWTPLGSLCRPLNPTPWDSQASSASILNFDTGGPDVQPAPGPWYK